MAGVLSSRVFHPGCICFLPVGFFLDGCLGGDLDSGLGISLFFASGVYLRVFLVASFVGDLHCFYIGCGVSFFWIWFGDAEVGSTTLFFS